MKTANIFSYPQNTHISVRINCRYVQVGDGKLYNLVPLAGPEDNKACWIAFEDRSPWSTLEIKPTDSYEQVGWGNCQLKDFGPEGEKALLVLWEFEGCDKIEAEGEEVRILGRYQQEHEYFRSVSVLAILAPGQMLIAYPPQTRGHKTIVRNEDGEAAVYRQLNK